MPCQVKIIFIQNFLRSFDMDPTIRVNTVSAILGQLFMSLSIFGCQQNFVQRYCSMSSRSKVVKYVLIPINNDKNFFISKSYKFNFKKT
jgi:hypothetical protein